MHRLPQFFLPGKRKKAMDSRKNAGKPKLGRLNAAKNIDYDAPSSSSSLEDSSGSLYTRSMDTPDASSFRINGIDGEIDFICRTLGLNGPEDFGIPMEAWEARKLRSSSELLPKSRLHTIDSPKSEEVSMEKEDKEIEDELCLRVKDSVRISVEQSMAKTESLEWNESRMATTVECSPRSGINGARPPLLKPPPPMDVDNTWDILKTFAPLVDEENRDEVQKGIEPFVEGEGEGNIVGPVENSPLVRSWCSFTTSNDDDCSSCTTEPANISPNMRCKLIITTWIKGKRLGSGSFGSVYEAMSQSGAFFAVKEVSLLDEDSQGRQSIYQLQQEIALLSEFEHENIVQYYGTDTEPDGSKLYIFLELVSQGSLMSLYQRVVLTDSIVSAYTRQILCGLKYLHEQNVVHRDIKCANILVDVSGSVKLADFGLAKATKLNDVKSCKGTPFWMAPEVVNRKGQGYGLPADIWSLGCTVLEMLTQKLPYSEFENHMQALYQIGKGKLPAIPDSLSDDGRDFILQCLKVNPNDRLTAADLLNHPFVKRPASSSSGSASPYYRPGRRI
ncbi:mitogen-activated protein kinase kinase kinase 1-like [Cucurbita moschata]|uniref:mitogen-activated protein kinase kinase kinase n=1 Tax=Cucurbita moschata TaxID=3662 RepID=A0A6J1H3V2_CUCMO|nr:mitogen-activated protein kinase kinase kinase 1-like [Cucurbita moschata]